MGSALPQPVNSAARVSSRKASLASPARSSGHFHARSRGVDLASAPSRTWCRSHLGPDAAVIRRYPRLGSRSPRSMAGLHAFISAATSPGGPTPGER